MILGSLEECGYYFLVARFRAGYVSRLIDRRGGYYILSFWLYMYGLLQLIVCQDFNFV